MYSAGLQMEQVQSGTFFLFLVILKSIPCVSIDTSKFDEENKKLSEKVEELSRSSVSTSPQDKAWRIYFYS